MSNRDYSVLPASILLVCLALTPLAGIVGFLYGWGVISGVLMTWIVLAVIAVFVPWAVSQLDPRSLNAMDENS